MFRVIMPMVVHKRPLPAMASGRADYGIGVKVLTDAKLKAANKKGTPYRLGDSGQLYLQVSTPVAGTGE